VLGACGCGGAKSTVDFLFRTRKKRREENGARYHARLTLSFLLVGLLPLFSPFSSGMEFEAHRTSRTHRGKNVKSIHNTKRTLSLSLFPRVLYTHTHTRTTQEARRRRWRESVKMTDLIPEIIQKVKGTAIAKGNMLLLLQPQSTNTTRRDH
jgi:hypothetical protein